MRTLTWLSIALLLPLLPARVATTSGTINRVLHGIPEGSSSGTPHPGLIDLGLIVKKESDTGANYQITLAGMEVLRKFFEEGGKLPPVRDWEDNINLRFEA